MNSRSGLYLSIKLFFFLLLIAVRPTIGLADEPPESLSGRWIIVSYNLDGKDIPKEKVPLLVVSPGTVWKLFDDGTGEIAGTDVRYTYSKKKTSFTMVQLNFLGLKDDILRNADVTKKGDKITFETPWGLGSKLKLTIKPDKK